MVVMREMREKNRGDRPHTRGAHQPGFASFELGHLFGELSCVGMAVTGVDETRRRSITQRVDVVEIDRAINDAQVDRGNEWPTARARMFRCACTECRRTR